MKKLGFSTKAACLSLKPSWPWVPLLLLLLGRESRRTGAARHQTMDCDPYPLQKNANLAVIPGHSLYILSPERTSSPKISWTLSSKAAVPLNAAD